MAEINIKYIQLEPAAFLTDIDFQMMDAEQRGVYCSVIFYLYCNNGEIDLGDNSAITLLSNSTNRLAVISSYQKTGVEWQALWGKIAHKFQINGKILTHKRVAVEIKRAKKYKENKVKAGKKAMKKRWGDNRPLTKVSKVKVSKVNKEKNIHMEFVFLTAEEYQKLIDKFGEKQTLEKITELNDGIGSKGYKYKSHYHTILSWDRKNGKSEPNQRKRPITSSEAVGCLEKHFVR